MAKETVNAFRRTLNGHGVDLMSYTGGVTSAAHTDEDIKHTLRAFEQTLQTLVADGVLTSQTP
jgi:glutamate-1-semialdehyde 2,1-aminomutase